MCFGIRSTKRLQELRETYHDKPRVLDIIEREARFTLGVRYTPPEPEILVVEPDRVVPVFGREREKVLA